MVNERVVGLRSPPRRIKEPSSPQYARRCNFRVIFCGLGNLLDVSDRCDHRTLRILNHCEPADRGNIFRWNTNGTTQSFLAS